ncbi:unnamed protein product [Blepharisma stoltei]|uniref:Uncharacterized protein n=1 Tax=Blepharisma stoltei TaxID=1481888 RepID=A0AAU9IGW7_9CILI|nr:unnamed protein product [Blepharisma stoltei]
MEIRQRSLVQRLDLYFWPYTANNYIKYTIYFTPKCWLFFRFLGAAFCIMTFALSIVETPTFDFLVILADWGCVITSLYFSMTLYNYKYSNCWKITHFLYELSWCIDWTVVLLFWGIIYPTQTWGQSIQVTVLANGGVFIFILIDSINNQIWFFRKHVYLIVIIGFLYTLLHLIYTLAVRKVYDIVNYKNAYTYLIILGTYLMLIIIFILGAFLDKFKSKFGSSDLIPATSSFASSIADDRREISLMNQKNKR